MPIDDEEIDDNDEDTVEDDEEDEDEDEDDDDDDEGEEEGDDSDDDEEVVDEEDEAEAPKEKTKTAKSISPLAHVREKLNKESLFAEILKALDESNMSRAEELGPVTLGFTTFLEILPRLCDTARMLFLNYADIKKEASWAEMIPNVMHELDIFASLFKVKLPEKAIEMVVQAAYKNLDLWCPGGPAPTYAHWVTVRNSAMQEIQQSGSNNEEEEEDVTLETAVEMVKAAGNVIISQEKYERYRGAYLELHPKKKKKKTSK